MKLCAKIRRTNVTTFIDTWKMKRFPRGGHFSERFPSEMRASRRFDSTQNDGRLSLQCSKCYSVNLLCRICSPKRDL